jgi:hypothetical protein
MEDLIVSKEFTHQFVSITVSPVRGHYSQKWWDAVRNVLNTHYVHWFMCEESGKAREVNHLHAAIYTDEQPRDRVRANVSQRIRRVIRQFEGYNAYHTFNVELHENAYPFGYCQKENYKKESSASDQIERLLEVGLEDLAAAPDFKAQKTEDDFRTYTNETVELMRDYVMAAHPGPSAGAGSDYETPYHPHSQHWRASSLAAEMFRKEVPGMDSKRYRWVTRNAILVNSYFTEDREMADDYQDFVREKRKERTEERAYLGKKAREAEKPSSCCKATRYEKAGRSKCSKCGKICG